MSVAMGLKWLVGGRMLVKQSGRARTLILQANTLRKERFCFPRICGINPHPRERSGAKHPQTIKYFSLFFTNEMVEKVVDETNLYVKKLAEMRNVYTYTVLSFSGCSCMHSSLNVLHVGRTSRGWVASGTLA